MSSETRTAELENVDELRRELQEHERRSRALNDQIRLLELERRKLSAIVDHTDAGFILFGPDGRATWTNQIFRERFADAVAAEGGLEGSRCQQLLCGKPEPCGYCPSKKPFLTGSVAHHEMRLWVKDRFHHIYATAMPVVGADGDVEQSIVMLQDVTELEVVGQSVEALRSSEQRFRSIFEKVAVGMVTTKNDGAFLRVNPAFCTMLGYTESRLLRMKLADVCHPEDLERARRQLDGILAGERRAIDLEERFYRHDGTIAWGHTTAVWQFDEQHKATYSIALIQDITDRKRAERQLEDSKKKYEALVNSVEGIVWEADPRTFEFSFVSKRAEQILGYPVERWLTQPRFWRNHVHAEDLERVTEDCRKATAQKHRRELEYRMITADGRTVWIRDTIGVALEKDAVVKLRGVMVDVTERKRAEEALRRSEDQLRQAQKMEAVGRLAGGIAHDFNNLLTAIIGYTDFLIKGLGDNHPLLREAGAIGKAAASAADLTGQLLAFSRQQVLKPKVLDLNAVVSEMDMMLRRVIGEDIELETTLGESIGAVKADPGQLQQVIINLVVNARDAMAGGGKLTVQTTSVDLDESFTAEHSGVESGPYVMLAISDTGCGIDDETKSRLFEPFFTTKAMGKGTGLGLSTVYGIVKQSGGHIYVYSEIDRGSTFKVYLPRVETAESGDEPKPAATVEPATGTETILLVEDDQAVRELTREILEMSGYKVIEAPDGIEALSIIERLDEPIHLIMTDLVMPHLGGRDLARKAADLLPHTKVLFLSGYTDSAVMHQGLLDPGSAFLQKPFTPASLAHKVREVLEG